MPYVRSPAHFHTKDLYVAQLIEGHGPVEWYSCRLRTDQVVSFREQTQIELSLLISFGCLLLLDNLETHLPEVALQGYTIVPDLCQLLELLWTRRVRRNALFQVICASTPAQLRRIAVERTYPDPDGRQELLPTIRLDPAPVRVAIELDLPLIHPSLQPQAHLSVPDQTARNGHVQIQYIAAVTHVDDV